MLAILNSLMYNEVIKEMNMTFIDELQKNTNKYTLTENGAVTNSSSLDANLDYFALAGAMRKRAGESAQLFAKAYAADKQTALRTLFYLRDIRGGQGERDVFRACLQKLEDIDPQVAKLVIINDWIGEYGRYDDMFSLRAGESLGTIGEFIVSKLKKDEMAMKNGEPVSLLAKWMPSENASSKKSRTNAIALASIMGLKPSQYRKKVTALRKYIKLLEQQMSNNEWKEIDYSKVPSQAGRKHVKAFMRHDENRYRDFLGKAEKGEVKINTSTLYTYEVYNMVGSAQYEAANAMWNNLPDYTNGQDALVVADVSGSMTGQPMSVSVSLALYFAERNKGRFKNKFMTFSESPQVVDVLGSNLRERMNNIECADWGMSTNLEAVFNVILKSAKQSEGDMPKVLYIISDMEFNAAIRNPSDTVFENAKAAFAAEGLDLPTVVFWNVDARNDQVPVTKFDGNVTLISGLSQSTFQHAVGGKSPIELMNDVVNSERYERIKVSHE